jgi:hypothetical protein
MILTFTGAFMANKDKIRAQFAEEFPEDYDGIVKTVASFMPDMDSENITVINDGDYQGTLLYIIPKKTYQPNQYWSVKIYYGSCSGCDTFESIRASRSETEKLDDVMTLALHVAQEFAEVEGDTI